VLELIVLAGLTNIPFCVLSSFLSNMPRPIFAVPEVSVFPVF